MLSLVLLVFSFVFAIIAALVAPEPAGPFYRTVRWGWLAFAFFVASLIWGAGGAAVHIGRLSDAVLTLLG